MTQHRGPASSPKSDASATRFLNLHRASDTSALDFGRSDRDSEALAPYCAMRKSATHMLAQRFVIEKLPIETSAQHFAILPRGAKRSWERCPLAKRLPTGGFARLPAGPMQRPSLIGSVGSDYAASSFLPGVSRGGPGAVETFR